LSKKRGSSKKGREKKQYQPGVLSQEPKPFEEFAFIQRERKNGKSGNEKDETHRKSSLNREKKKKKKKKKAVQTLIVTKNFRLCLGSEKGEKRASQNKRAALVGGVRQKRKWNQKPNRKNTRKEKTNTTTIRWTWEKGTQGSALGVLREKESKKKTNRAEQRHFTTTGDRKKNDFKANKGHVENSVVKEKN